MRPIFTGQFQAFSPKPSCCEAGDTQKQELFYDGLRAEIKNVRFVAICAALLLCREKERAGSPRLIWVSEDTSMMT